MPQDVVKAGYEALMKRRVVCVPGTMNKALVASRRILSEGAQASLNEAFCKKVPLEDQKREAGVRRGRYVKAQSASGFCCGVRCPQRISVRFHFSAETADATLQICG